jgi:outer membrane protein insertion porin family
MRHCVVFVFMASFFAYAQQNVLGPQSVYEGQNVDAVDLIGNPHRNLEPLRSVVTQKAKEPYSESKVEASIAALQKTGGFPKVNVQVVPDASGLRLNFLLEPAYYIGIVDFPGATKHFSYIRLLEISDLSDEDPYDPARIPIAEHALREFFARNGYFQASVHTNSRIDDQHTLVSVDFDVNLGKRARLANVEIEGTDSAETAHLLHALTSLRARLTGGLLKRGKPYTEERLKAATALIKSTLAKQHRLASSVKQNPPRFHSENDRVDISFKVEPGAVVNIRTQGAKLSVIPYLSKREMKKLIPIYSEGTIDQDLVNEGQENLVDYFQRKGYSDVKVNTNFTRQADQIPVVYDIDRGQKRKVDRIAFHGNNQIKTNALMAQVVVKRSHLWSHGSVSPKLLRQSVSNIESLYSDRGYESAKVTSHSANRGSKLGVTFEIEEGPQTIVDKVAVTGNKAIPQDQLTQGHGFGLRPGGAFSPRRLSEDRNRISAAYLDRGYLNAEVKATVSRNSGDRDRISVTYAINEHQMVHVDNVLYLGQKKTRDSLLKKTANIPNESPMRKEQLLEAESRLYDLNIFDWTSVGPEKPITDQTEETALVKVHEAKQNEIIYGFGFEVSRRGGNIPNGTVAVPGLPPIGLGSNQIAPSEATYASPLGSIEFDRHNMRGLAETASASILLSRLDQRLIATYTQPHFFGSQWSSLSSFSLERTSENPLFTAELGDLSFQLERVLSRKKNTRLQLRYDFNKTLLSDLLVPELVLPQDRNVRLSTFSGTLIRDTRDKPLDAHRGIYTTINFGITPSALGSNVNFGKLFAQFATYKSMHSIVFANSIRIGMAKSFSGSFVPTSQLFFSGGGTSLRGFPLDEAGPQRIVPFCNVLQNQTGCVNITVPLGGRQLFILNSEVRFPLKVMKDLGGVVFYDGGNVYSAINMNNFFDNYSNTVGVGLRYSTPIGPVRVDLGRNLSPVPGLNPTQYFITIGQSF